MEIKTWFVVFVIFVISRALITQIIPPLLYTIIIFSVPLVYFIYKREFYLFYFNLTDTLPSIGINLTFSIIFIMFLLVGGFLFGNYNWVLLLTSSISDIILGLLTSFFQEMLFRYFIQYWFFKMTNNDLLSIILTSVASSIVLLPSIVESFTYLIMGLVIGYIFYKTKDIYGATMANWIISTFIRVIA
ncbi:Uncharacterised protein [Candidatus Tiddalikarchaeum anstoanum]|nr:Uncharacterised protein [Candidatus Tiddalikarchaeum anstoanum]